MRYQWFSVPFTRNGCASCGIMLSASKAILIQLSCIFGYYIWPWLCLHIVLCIPTKMPSLSWSHKSVIPSWHTSYSLTFTYKLLLWSTLAFYKILKILDSYCALAQFLLRLFQPSHCVTNGCHVVVQFIHIAWQSSHPCVLHLFLYPECLHLYSQTYIINNSFNYLYSLLLDWVCISIPFIAISAPHDKVVCCCCCCCCCCSMGATCSPPYASDKSYLFCVSGLSGSSY